MNGTFNEQLGGVAKMFEQWGTCERTVVACALARKVPWPGLRLVQRAVEAALQSHVEDERLERDANDETLLASLLAARADDDDKEDLSNALNKIVLLINYNVNELKTTVDGERLRQLLTLLPLLRTDNERAKNVYAMAAPALVQRCLDAPRRGPAADLCRQLLCYLLVHPALSTHDQRTLTQWLRYLENHISGNRTTEAMWQQRIDPCLLPETNIWASNNSFRRTIGKNVEFRGILDTVEQTSYTDILQESFSKNGRDVDVSLDGEMLNFDAAIAQPKSQRSNSLTPPSSNFMQMSSSAENLSDEPFVQKPRSFSLSSEYSLSQLRPIGVMYGTTGSETRLDDLRCNNFAEHPGMSTVGQWLKGLRLHKYVWLFTNITYEQMMAMDDKYLEKLGVTKGARHKLLLSIKKLSERAAALETARAELSAGAAARALERLRAALLAPMPPGDLPAALVAALDHASSCLMGGACAEAAPDAVDPVALHCWLIEKALHHESFSAPSLQAALRRLRHRLPPGQFFHLVGDAPHRRNKHRWRAPPAPRRRWAPPPRGKSHSYPPFPPHALPPPHDYSSLDALCLQMTETAID